jgi:hypothetical protein
MRIAGSLLALVVLPTVAQGEQQDRFVAPRATMHSSYRPAPITRPRTIPHVVGRPLFRTSMPQTRLTSLPPRAARPIARSVRFHGRLLAIPAVVAIGIPVFLDVPDLGEVGVPEDDYPEIYRLLTSDDAADQEKAFALLQSLKNANPIGSVEAQNASQTTSPSSFRIVHPPQTASSVAPDSARDLAEPLNFDDPAPNRRIRGLW